MNFVLGPLALRIYHTEAIDVILKVTLLITVLTYLGLYYVIGSIWNDSRC
jgi:hypothetical protein